MNIDLHAFVHLLATIAIPLVFAITLHEAAHGWAAKKLGDKTAYMLGRVSLNPTRHIDPIGTIIVPLACLVMTAHAMLFGWAKPVPITLQNLKNPRRDMALVALAGPAANALMAFIWLGIAKLSWSILSGSPSNIAIVETFKYFLSAGLYGIMINIVLMILNLLPIPPLDGGRIVSCLIPPRWALYYDKIEPYGIFIVLALFLTGILSHVILSIIQLLAPLMP